MLLGQIRLLKWYIGASGRCTLHQQLDLLESSRAVTATRDPVNENLLFKRLDRQGDRANKV